MRSGIVAFGKEVSGQPLQSDASLISIGELSWLFECPSALSRAQIETQAKNIHIKLIGSNAATNLLSGEQVVNIVKIIHIQLGLRYSSCQRQVGPTGGHEELKPGLAITDHRERYAEPIQAALELPSARNKVATEGS